MNDSSRSRSSSVRSSYAKSIRCLRLVPAASVTALVVSLVSGQGYLLAGMGPRYGLGMAQVETVRGPVDTGSLGTTLMHEHVFVLNEEIRLNYPAEWDEEARLADAVAKLNAGTQGGSATVADPAVIGLGRDIRRIQRVAAGTGINIIVAAGLYTYDEVPFYFRYRGAQRQSASSDPMTAMFIADITEGIPGTGVKA